MSLRGAVSVRVVGALLVVATGLVLVLRFVAESTRIEAGSEAGSPDPALEVASETLRWALRAAGTGLPSWHGVDVLCRDAPCPQGPKDERGMALPLAEGSDVVAVRGVLLTPVVFLDPFDRSTGLAYSGAGGTWRAVPRRARLNVPVFPLAFNPPRIWVLAPEGLGKALGAPPAGSPPRRNEPLEPVAEALNRDPHRLFAAWDARGNAVVAVVSGANAETLDRGCACNAPAAAPGDCPPGRVGCRLELTLDFADPAVEPLMPGGSVRALERLGPPVAGGLLDEVLFAVVRPAVAGGGARPWLAMARRVAADRFEVSRVAEGIESLRVDLGGAAQGALATVELRASAERTPGDPSRGARRTASIRVALNAGQESR